MSGEATRTRHPQAFGEHGRDVGGLILFAFIGVTSTASATLLDPTDLDWRLIVIVGSAVVILTVATAWLVQRSLDKRLGGNDQRRLLWQTINGSGVLPAAADRRLWHLELDRWWTRWSPHVTWISLAGWTGYGAVNVASLLGLRSAILWLVLIVGWAAGWLSARLLVMPRERQRMENVEILIQQIEETFRRDRRLGGDPTPPRW